MSMNRQRSRARHNGGRASTLPVALSREDVVSGTPYPPSIEESLQDWLSRSISETSNSTTQSLLDGTCRCCSQPDCEAYEKLANAVRKLEGDARLAAEIGQSLLDKHEMFVNESNEVKATLEQQIVLVGVTQIIGLADDDPTLRETVADLEVANARCLQLSSDITAKTVEIDKLRIFKFMVRQADTREENLRAKLEDTKQELAISRKAELTLESKHKKLKSRYGKTLEIV
ncbi:hypothetical protein BX666DRAFT_2046138 [Dichotomocladium elegans]|nr:hypothetical protein BX666DRAFT_2046138 [Dichotomocladium elegans]